METRRARKNVTTDFLAAIGALDTSARPIKNSDLIEVKCCGCSKTAQRTLESVKDAFRHYGFGWQCPGCRLNKYRNRSDSWKENIRRAAQSPEHKERAVKNGKKRIKYTEEQIRDVLVCSGVTRIEGDLSTPSNTIEVWWPDGSHRRIRIRRFMVNGLLSPPKTGSRDQNHARYLEKINSLGLSVEPLGNKRARLTYRGYTWEQRWVNCIDGKCRRMMRKVDIGRKIEELIKNGVSLNIACKQVGVAPVTFYRRFRQGFGAVEAAISVKSFEHAIRIEGAVYNREVFDDSRIRPDIYVESAKLVIEIDGMRTHCEVFKERDYHYRRFLYYRSKGVKLLAFSEKEVCEKREIVWSMINHRLGKSPNRIGARECDVGLVVAEEAAAFFEANHLHGKGSGTCWGLFYQNKLVAALRFVSMPDFINVSRFACLNGWSVVGAYSRLVSMLPGGKKIINFVDARHGDGEHLLRLGFALVHEHIGFEWTDLYNNFNRRAFLGQTGYDYGLVKFYDYGQRKYVREVQTGSCG